MNVASLEPCRELYELSGWEVPKVGSAWWFTYPDGDSAVWASEKPEHWDEALDKYPAYDLGYLLRRLPHPELRNIKDFWWCHGDLTMGIRPQTADTPEDAAAKLAIELFKQGVLKKEG